MEILQKGDGYGSIASAMGMTVSMARRIIVKNKMQTTSLFQEEEFK